MDANIRFSFGLLLVCLFLSACQPKVYLMPSPVGENRKLSIYSCAC